MKSAGSSAFNISIWGAPIAYIYIRTSRFSHFLQRHDYSSSSSKSELFSFLLFRNKLKKHVICCALLIYLEQK